VDKSRRGMLSFAVPVGAAALALGTVKSARAANVVQSLTTAINNFVPGVGGFVGTLTVSSFQVVNGVLSAIGTISGNVLNATGGVVGSVTQAITLPVGVSGSCQILSLTLGPLDLNLLGLMIHLNQIVLTITAVPGAGNLLGNLLCSVANLLNNGGTVANLLTTLQGLLNQILAAL
jgi:hypothetical protein